MLALVPPGAGGLLRSVHICPSNDFSDVILSRVGPGCPRVVHRRGCAWGHLMDAAHPPGNFRTYHGAETIEGAEVGRSSWGWLGQRVERVFRATDLCQLMYLGCQFIPRAHSLPHLGKNPPANEVQDRFPEGVFSQEQAFISKTSAGQPCTLQQSTEDPSGLSARAPPGVGTPR